MRERLPTGQRRVRNSIIAGFEASLEVDNSSHFGNIGHFRRHETATALADLIRALATATPAGDSEGLRVAAHRMVQAVQGVLMWRSGELPDKGYIRDNVPSRTAIEAMAMALVDLRAALATATPPEAVDGGEGK